MASICPKDLKPCPDDLCRGSGICAASQGTQELLEQCAVCRQPYCRDRHIDCACERDDYDDDTCQRCGGDGLIHDCIEDTCCCADPIMTACPECNSRFPSERERA